MKRILVLIAVLMALPIFAQTITVNDWPIPSKGNGGKVYIAPKDNSGNPQYLAAFDPVAKTVTLGSGVTGPGFVPLGGMVAVMPTLHANAWQPPASGAIKDGFMRADGATVSAQNVTDGSVFPAGTVLPNMVGNYPKGDTTSGGTGGSTTITSNVTVSTQPAFTVPGHYHNTFVLTAAGQTLGTTNVTSGAGSAHFHYQGYGTTGANGYHITVDTANGGVANAGTGVTVTGDESSHKHSTNIAHTHGSSSVSGSVGYQSGSNGDAVGGFAATRSTNVALNNAAVTYDPPYVDVVWVIRVK